MRICIKCDRKHYAKGFCGKHYKRFLTHGDPLKLIFDGAQGCKVDQCNEKHGSKGYCDKHYYRFKVYGDPLELLHNMDRDPICTIGGCENKHAAKGFCMKHYHMEYPEKKLKSNKKYLAKLGKPFDMNSNGYRYAHGSWSKSVKKRDNNTCQICNKKGNSRTINAHHIFFRALYPQLSLNINNGISLCKTCHSGLHGFEIYYQS